MRGRLWRCLRRRSIQAAADLGATLAATSRDQHPLRMMRRLVGAAARQCMRPVDSLLFGLDRRSDEEAGEFLSKRALTRLENALNPPRHHHLVQNKLGYHVACVERGVAAPRVLAVISFEPGEVRGERRGAAQITGSPRCPTVQGSCSRRSKAATATGC